MDRYLKWVFVVAGGLSLLVLAVAAFIPVEKGASVLPAKYDEVWCEQMMVKPSKEWVEAEIQAFAKHCLTED